MALITSRTQADVLARNEKGVYRAEDLNRVESAAGALSQDLQGMEEALRAYAQAQGVPWRESFSLPFEPQAAFLTARTDWTPADWPTGPQMRRYLQNIRKLCGLLEVPAESLPQTMSGLTWQGANAIEQALLNCQQAAAQLEREKKTLIEEQKGGGAL